VNDPDECTRLLAAVDRTFEEAKRRT